jgi:LysR family glycine cleavage system transcriptional activator
MSRRDFPPLNTLRVFWVVMRRGKLCEAAGELEVTAQAVGHQIRVLEEILQIRLFDRRPNGLMPTEQAVLLFHFVRSGFDELEEGLARISRPPSSSRAIDHSLSGSVS